jgi:hypothetical protein
MTEHKKLLERIKIDRMILSSLMPGEGLSESLVKIARDHGTDDVTGLMELPKRTMGGINLSIGAGAVSILLQCFYPVFLKEIVDLHRSILPDPWPFSNRRCRTLSSLR